MTLFFESRVGINLVVCRGITRFAVALFARYYLLTGPVIPPFKHRDIVEGRWRRRERYVFCVILLYV